MPAATISELITFAIAPVLLDFTRATKRILASCALMTARRVTVTEVA